MLKKIQTLGRLPKFTTAVGIVVVSAFVIAMALSAQYGGGPDMTAPSASSAAAPTPAKIAGGSAYKFSAADATDNPCTTSTAGVYVDMPGMSRPFTQTVSDEVLVLFQGEWISGTGRPLIRLLIDGVVQPGPGDAASPFAPWEGAAPGTAGFNFISNPVAPGPHTAKIQWSSVFGDNVCVDERSMIVLYR